MTVRILAAALGLGAMMQEARTMEIEIYPDRTHQTWEGAGACLATWTGAGTIYESRAFEDLFLETMGMTILRVDLLPIVLGTNGLHDFKEVQFGPDPEKNLALFHYEAPANRRMTLYADTARRLAARSPELKVIGSVWTPPHWMKTRLEGSKNKPEIIHGGNDSANGTLQFTRENLEQYARYMVAAVLAFEKASGVPLYALSIQNEAFFEQGFNSMKLMPEDYPKALVSVAREFKRVNKPMKFYGPEDVIYDDLSKKHVLDRALSYCHAIMKNKEAAQALHAFAVHGYGGDGINSDIDGPGHWEYYFDNVKKYGKPVWQTETGGGSPERGLKSFAPALMESMIRGNNSMWANWQLVDSGPVGEHTLVGADLNPDTLKAAVARHFFQFIRPDSVRFETKPDSKPGGVSVCAWRHPKTGAVTFVLLNVGQAEDVRLKLPTAMRELTFDRFETTTKKWFERLEPMAGAGTLEVSLPKSSLTTLHAVAAASTPLPEPGAEP